MITFLNRFQLKPGKTINDILKNCPESLYGYNNFNKTHIEETYKNNQKIDVCKSCWASIIKGKVPETALVNGLTSDQIPKCIADLNAIELICIQRIRPIQVGLFIYF